MKNSIQNYLQTINFFYNLALVKHSFEDDQLLNYIKFLTVIMKVGQLRTFESAMRAKPLTK